MNDRDQNTAPQKKTDNPLPGLAIVLAIGVYFGVLLNKTEVASWERIHQMFLFREARMYLIIGTAIVVAMVSMLAIKAAGVKSLSGKPIRYEPKPFHKGVVIGGMMFGAGWAITGACPGPMAALLGTGASVFLVVMISAILGTRVYGMIMHKLPH